jgi:hypothetical protein
MARCETRLLSSGCIALHPQYGNTLTRFTVKKTEWTITAISACYRNLQNGLHVFKCATKEESRLNVLDRSQTYWWPLVLTWIVCFELIISGSKFKVGTSQRFIKCKPQAKYRSIGLIFCLIVLRDALRHNIFAVESLQIRKACQSKLVFANQSSDCLIGRIFFANINILANLNRY